MDEPVTSIMLLAFIFVTTCAHIIIGTVDTFVSSTTDAIIANVAVSWVYDRRLLIGYSICVREGIIIMNTMKDNIGLFSELMECVIKIVSSS
jgi:hypothetical protein